MSSVDFTKNVPPSAAPASTSLDEAGLTLGQRFHLGAICFPSQNRLYCPLADAVSFSST